MEKRFIFKTGLLFFLMLIFSMEMVFAQEADVDIKQAVQPANTAVMNADDIIQKANLAAYYAGDDGMSDVKMTITDAQGRERNREFRILRRDVEQGKQQKFFVYFSKPADVSKMVYMVWKHLDKEDDRWLYLPALDLVRRIAASDKRSSFVGSHFVYEDVSGRSPEADVHELLEEDDAALIKIKNTPKNSDEVEFAYYYVWIRKSDFIPARIKYYDGQDKLIRSVESLEIEDVDGNPTVMKSKVTDLVRGGETTMTFSNVQYDVGLQDNIFTERYLRRAPAKWIQ